MKRVVQTTLNNSIHEQEVHKYYILFRHVICNRRWCHFQRTSRLLALEKIKQSDTRVFRPRTMFGAVSRASRHSGGVQVCFNNGATSSSRHSVREDNNSNNSKGKNNEFSGEYNEEALLATSFFADDYSGPALTKMNGPIPMRALSSNAAESYFIRESTFNDHDKYKDNNVISLAYRPKDVFFGSNNSTFLSAYEKNVNKWGKGKDDSEDMSNVSFEIGTSMTDEEYNGISSNNNNNQRYRSRSGNSSRPYCRLCGSVIEFHGSTKMHMLTNSKIYFTNHACREVVFDSVYLLAIRGYPVQHMELVWANVLYNSPMFARIPQLVDRTATINQRAEVLLDLLSVLKDANILELCFNVTVLESATEVSSDFKIHRRKIAAERLEYIGDSLGALPIINRLYLLFPDQQWQYSDRVFSFNTLRESIEMNATLSYAFDILHMNSLNPKKLVSNVIGLHKAKADFMEAMIGELRQYTFDFVPEIDDDVPYLAINGAYERKWYGLIEHCLNELYDLIILVALREMSWRCIPLAQELAADYLWLTAKRELHHTRSRRFIRGNFSEPKLAETLLPSPSNNGLNVSTEANGISTVTSCNTPNDASLQNQNDFGNTNIDSSYCLQKDSNILKAVSGSFILPANIQLSSHPCTYPTHIPHPLLQEPDPATLKITCSEYSKRDFFEAFHACFNELGLINDDARNTFSRVRRPQFNKWIVQLVPNVMLGAWSTEHISCDGEDSATNANATNSSTNAKEMTEMQNKVNMKEEYLSNTSTLSSPTVDMSVTDISSMHTDNDDDDDDEDDVALFSKAQNNKNTIPIKSNMENDIFFADPYYDLFPHKIHSSLETKYSTSIEGNGVDDTISKSGTNGSNKEKEVIGGQEEAKKTRERSASLTVKGIQRAAHLPILTACNPLTSHNDRLSHALSSIYPFLESEPSHFDAMDGVGMSGDGNHRSNSNPNEPECMFASSTLVPCSVKPPSAGVITDRNLYKGQFAFWGFTLAERVALAKIQQEEKLEEEQEEEQQKKMKNTENVQQEDAKEQRKESKVEKLQVKDNVKSLLNLLKDEAASGTLEEENDVSAPHSLPPISCQSEEEIDKALKFFVKVSKARRTAQSKYFNIRALRIVANYARESEKTT